jgi:bifunctional non-homologous end joining protein LigD
MPWDGDDGTMNMRAKEPLAAYWKKRDFDLTREPRGRGRNNKERRALCYVVQRHEARRLHYDFRLEWDGVLMSWAVPKGPSLDPQVKRLAIQVEDHPLDYGSFEGDIPNGQYGAGHVAIWDRGIWLPHGDPHKDLPKGHLRFDLQGGQLAGGWVLFRTGKEGNQWILRKLADRFAVPGHESESPPAIEVRTTKAIKTAGKQLKAISSSILPKRIEPQLATLVDAPPPGDRWSYEVKYDGYRMLCRLEGKKADFVSRNEIEWTARMKALARAIAALHLGTGWLDGEVVCFDEHGVSRFQSLQNALDGQAGHLSFVVFDVLFWEGKDLRQLPCRERQDFLQRLLADLPENAPILFTQRLGVADGTQASAAWTEACRLGLEGLLCKDIDAPYTSGRSKTWLKLKCRPRQEFVVGGYILRGVASDKLRSLMVGLWENGKWVYAGKVGTGFNASAHQALMKRLKPLQIDTMPFATLPAQSGRFSRQGDARVWVKPEVVVEIAYAGWTADQLLRQASYLGLREDKPANEVHKEVSIAGPGVKVAHSVGLRKTATSPASDCVSGIVISHAQRLVYRDPDITKLQLVRYYEAIASYMLPHVRGRRLALLRCPSGTGAPCFFQKHLNEDPPEGVELDEGHLVITSAVGLISLVQRGVVEFHTWGSTTPHADKADRMTIDLDPDPNVAWQGVVEAAQLSRALLQELGLVSFLKTTGGKGLHLVVPIQPTQPWDVIKTFARNIALHLATVIPDRFTAHMSKVRRKDKIFVDYLRNGNGATAIAAFSARARQGAAVSLPILWDELDPNHDLRGAVFNVSNALEYAMGRSDPWADYKKGRKAVTKKMIATVAR